MTDYERGRKAYEALLDRIEALHELILERAEAEGYGEPEEFFAAIICNNCGRKLVAHDSLGLAVGAEMEGWSIGTSLGDADLCRVCAS